MRIPFQNQAQKAGKKYLIAWGWTGQKMRGEDKQAGAQAEGLLLKAIITRDSLFFLSFCLSVLPWITARSYWGRESVAGRFLECIEEQD